MRTSTGTGFDNGAEIPKVDALGRRRWSIEQSERIVAEALAPDTSVAEVARRHGLNANLIFKWLKCAKDGGPDRRRRPAARGEPITFVPIQVVAKTGFDAVAAPVRALTIDHAAPPRTQGAGEKPPGKPRREVNGSARHGAIEISLPSGARVSVGAEADEAVLRLVLSAHEGAVMLQVAPGVRVYLACPQHGTSARRKMSGELGSRALERLAPFHSQNLRNSRILREARVLN